MPDIHVRIKTTEGRELLKALLTNPPPIPGSIWMIKDEGSSRYRAWYTTDYYELPGDALLTVTVSQESPTS